MARVRANDIEIEYDTFGDPSDPALLLVMGLGGQLIAWDPEFCGALADRGLYVIRYDNRDVGKSTWFDQYEFSFPQWLLTAAGAMLGLPVPLPYTMRDMGADAAGLLDALDIESAHVCGVSMGGMIAQQLTIDHPHKVRSLASIMSKTGERNVGGPSLKVMWLLARPPGADRETRINRELDLWAEIGTDSTYDPEFWRERAIRSYERAFHPAGVARQTLAVLGAESRAAGLRGVTVPTVVMHGTEDPIVRVDGGIRTAELVPGADLILLGGHGHDLPTSARERVLEAVTTNIARARTPSRI